MGLRDMIKKRGKESKNFKYLDDLIHSGAKEIVLDFDIVLSGGEKSAYERGIKLDVDDLTIDGNGHTIDGAKKRRILWVFGKNVTLKNIIFKNGDNDYSGGAIHNKGELTIESCTFIENTSLLGGAICNDSELTIRRSTFTKNASRQTLKTKVKSYGYDSQRYGGGAIFNQGTAAITESVLCENRAENKGGAIYNEGGPRHGEYKMEIFKTKFSMNTAEKKGGSICNANKMIISQSELSKNTLEGIDKSEDLVGIIKNEGELTITHSSIKDNETNDYGIIVNSKFLKCWECEISNNESSLSIITNWDHMEINNSNFNNNKSKRVITVGTDSTLNIFQGTFEDNYVSYSLISNWGKSCIIDKTVFKNLNSNSINNYSNLTLMSPIIFDDGKSILNEGYILLKKESSNLKKHICGDGTVDINTDLIPSIKTYDFGYLTQKIRQRSSNEIVLNKDIHLEKYEYDFYEGGIELDVDGLIINGNGHTIDGANRSRIFLIMADNITLKNITFKNGRSHRNYDSPLNSRGGSIKVNRKKLSIENCKFLNSTSEEQGGAIAQEKGELTITECEFRQNNAEYAGGAIICDKGKLTIAKSTFSKNTSEIEGGAIQSVGIVTPKEETSFLTVTDSTFTENSTGYRGGAIRDYFGINNISNSTFTGNTAKEEDGGALILYGALAEIGGCTFTKNLAGRHGGAIFEQCMVFTFSGCTLSENTAKVYGGAICTQGSITIKETVLTKNKSKKGAVYSIALKKSLKNCKVDNITISKKS